MLILQKASAGSGKTYTLTREYIIYLLTIRLNDGTLRFRKQPELEDSARHILAITFTNKATAEMKGRIVKCLAKLASYNIGDKKPDYLEYIAQLLHVDESEVCDIAKTALSILLNNYSDFQVSTIDSFFQTILRTFAHEIGISDTYGIEMDSDIIASSAFDATLTELNTANANKNVREWIRALMHQAISDNQAWNIFNKSKMGLYNNVVEAVKKMSAEDFKKKREQLEQFVNDHPDTAHDFAQLNDHFNQPLIDALESGKKGAKEALQLIQLHKLEDAISSQALGRIKKMAAATHKLESFKYTGTDAFSSKKVKSLTPEQQRVQDLYEIVLAARDNYEAAANDPAYLLWKLYKKNLKLLPLMLYAAGKSTAMLAENNVVDISETNTILRRVIGDDDTPFIYERIGSRLNHYLIDEFQDTSAMQWDNLRPLLDESMSHDHANLIIGDAKQSIYRFRNADPSIITKRVPADFTGRVDHRGEKEEENTNYRSLRTIVETNNTIFYNLARKMDAVQAELEGSSPVALPGFYENLYSNTTQCPNKTERMGYFEMQFVDMGKGDGDDIPSSFDNIGSKIKELLDRGYRMADILVLVRRKKTGRAVVRSILKYNVEHPDSPINIVSDESLLIESCDTVRTIVSVLRLLAEGTLAKTPDEDVTPNHDTNKNNNDNPKPDPTISKTMFDCRYQLISFRHSDYTPEQVIAEINANPNDHSHLRELVQEIDSLTLPSLVEATLLKFISEDRRKADAPYIAAFQDLVLEYCDMYSPDIFSFLQWWDIIKEKASLTSPEGLNAVSVLTIHKAKGLEYQCVIIPNLAEKIVPDPNKKEWRWVHTDTNTLNLPAHLAGCIPTYLPVETSEEMAKTVHKDEYITYMRQFRMDVINNWYVAFTRAVAELYVFAPSNPGNTMVASMIVDSLKDANDDIFCGIPPEMVSITMEEKTVKQNKGEKTIQQPMSIVIGRPLTAEEIANLDSKPGSKVETAQLTDYFVSDPSQVLVFRNPEAGYSNPDDPDPRSIGNRMHDIMASVHTITDLKRAVNERQVSGHISRKEAREIYKLLSAKITHPRYAPWFAPELQVINERTVFDPKAAHSDTDKRDVNKRPDRIIIDANQCATVIDYKFGTVRDDAKYKKQVGEYMRRLKNIGKFSAVKGYVWYVMLDEAIEVK